MVWIAAVSNVHFLVKKKKKKVRVWKVIVNTHQLVTHKNLILLIPVCLSV